MTHTDYQHELREAEKRLAEREARGEPLTRLRFPLASNMALVQRGESWSKRRPAA